VGSALAFAGSQLVARLLYGVTPQDPRTIAFAVLALLAVAFTAASVPARRASENGSHGGPASGLTIGSTAVQ
jgi:hypothetical protein